MEDIEDYEEHEPWHRGPIRIILGLFLLLIIITMVIPFYGIKTNPEPKTIIKIEEIFPDGINEDIENKTLIDKREDYYKLVHPDDPVIKFAADRIVTEGCKTTNRVCYAKAIFYFVRDNFQYVNDPQGFEYVKSGKQSLMSKGGDCDDASVLMSSLLRAIGIDTRFVFEPGHVYVQAFIPKALEKYKTKEGWINLDGTCRYCDFGEIPIK